MEVIEVQGEGDLQKQLDVRTGPEFEFVWGIVWLRAGEGLRLGEQLMIFFISQG